MLFLEKECMIIIIMVEFKANKIVISRKKKESLVRVLLKKTIYIITTMTMAEM
jgi:hypothetical protein